jgi:hypothetical protein
MKSKGLVDLYTYLLLRDMRRRSATNSMYLRMRVEVIPMRATGRLARLRIKLIRQL